MPLVTACSEPRCPAPAVDRGRCAAHRRTTAERGYGADHRYARSELAATLPAPCGYCRPTIQRGDAWVAAHLIDGAPEHGYLGAHPDCNERAKRRGGPNRPAAVVPQAVDDVAFRVIGCCTGPMPALHLRAGG